MSILPIRAALALGLAAGGLAACEGGFGDMGGFAASSGGPAAFTPITTEEAFRTEVVGREVTYANGAVGAYGADGTWTVTQGDAAIGGGTWEWSGDRWCRTGSTVDGPVEPACDAVEISSTGVRFTSPDGTAGVLPFRT